MVPLIARPGRIAATLRALVLAAAVPSMSAAFASGRTIVGTWAPDPRLCTPTEGMIAIDPLSMVGDEFRCRFADVVRSGDVVTWHGTCGFPEDDRSATVVSKLRGDALTVVINGGSNGPYRRCKPD